MRGWIVAATVVVSVSVSLSAWPGPEIREYEDALVIAENDRPVVRLTLQPHASTGQRQLEIATLYDPYGEPYLTSPRERALPAAVDWGVSECRIGDRAVGPYRGNSAFRTFERWTRGRSENDRAVLSMQRAWLDPSTGQAFVLETANVTVYSQQYYRRVIDISVKLVNVGTETVTLPADASFVVRFDSGRPEAGFRTPENEYRTAPFRYRGPWLSGSSVSLSRMKMMGVALFNDASERGGEAADFVAHRDGTVEMSASSESVTLEPGDSTHWSARVFCFADKLPARAIHDSYLGYLTGRTW